MTDDARGGRKCVHLHICEHVKAYCVSETLLELSRSQWINFLFYCSELQ